MAKTDTKKVWNVIGTIAAVVVVAVLIQWGRFYSKSKDLVNGTTVVFPKNYFPFNGAYSKQNDKLTKTT